MQTGNLAAVEATRAKLRQLEVDRAARPHCTVTGSSLAHALKSLATIFEQGNSGNSVMVSFDGRKLSFDCNGLTTVVVATGIAWPAQLPTADGCHCGCVANSVGASGGGSGDLEIHAGN
jgi:hypothetical protein